MVCASTKEKTARKTSTRTWDIAQNTRNNTTTKCTARTRPCFPFSSKCSRNYVELKNSARQTGRWKPTPQHHRNDTDAELSAVLGEETLSSCQSDLGRLAPTEVQFHLTTETERIVLHTSPNPTLVFELKWIIKMRMTHKYESFVKFNKRDRLRRAVITFWLMVSDSCWLKDCRYKLRWRKYWVYIWWFMAHFSRSTTTFPALPTSESLADLHTIYILDVTAASTSKFNARHIQNNLLTAETASR